MRDESSRSASWQRHRRRVRVRVKVRDHAQAGQPDAKQHGQNEIVGTHPNPLVGEDVKKYRELYDAVNQVTS